LEFWFGNYIFIMKHIADEICKYLKTLFTYKGHKPRIEITEGRNSIDINLFLPPGIRDADVVGKEDIFYEWAEQFVGVKIYLKTKRDDE